MGSSESKIHHFSFTSVLQRALEEAAILEQISDWIHSSKSISIFLTGKTGSGKSTLVNTLVGQSVAKEGDDLDPMTAEVTCYTREQDGITLKIWDSPGLQDGTGREERYIADMKAKCKNIDLYLLCINISDLGRFNSDCSEIKAIKKLSETFGSSMWDNATIALTFANEIEDNNQPMRDAKRRILAAKDRISCLEKTANEEEIKAAKQTLEEEKAKLENLFCDKIREWDRSLREMLEREIKVDPAKVKAVKIIPTGFSEPQSLPDRPHWLTTFWFSALTSTHKRAQPALLHLNRKRIVESPDQVSEKDIEKHIHDQVVIFSERGSEFGGEVGNSARGLCVGLKVAHIESLRLMERMFIERFLSFLCDDDSEESSENDTSECGGHF